MEGAAPVVLLQRREAVAVAAAQRAVAACLAAEAAAATRMERTQGGETLEAAFHAVEVAHAAVASAAEAQMAATAAACQAAACQAAVAYAAVDQLLHTAREGEAGRTCRTLLCAQLGKRCTDADLINNGSQSLFL